MVVTTEIEAGPLADLVKQVEAGNEVLLTQGDKPVARVVAARESDAGQSLPLIISSFKGHRVLAPLISQADLADDLFNRQ